MSEQNPSKKTESTPQQEFRLERSSNRHILYIPINLYRKVGGKNGITNIFKSVYGGSSPMWAEEFDDFYAVEITPDYNRETRNDELNIEKLEAFKKNILAASR